MNRGFQFRYPLPESECIHDDKTQFGRGNIAPIHLYCYKCGSHWYDGKYYTAEEWYRWINEEGDD